MPPLKTHEKSKRPRYGEIFAIIALDLRICYSFKVILCIFASSDLIAAQVIQVCAEMGKQIPDDIKLVGFDDVALSSLTTPQISTIHQPTKEMAEMAVDSLIKTGNQETVPSKIVLPVSLVKRRSTGW